VTRTGNAGLQATRSGGESQSRLFPVHRAKRIALARRVLDEREITARILSYEHRLCPLDAPVPRLHRSRSRFLYIVATHSATCARQYPRLQPPPIGATEPNFWNKLHTKKHARKMLSKERTVYHLFSRPALPQIDRGTSVIAGNTNEYIQRRIGMLIVSPTRIGDTSKPSRKSQYFCNQLKSQSFLPSKIYHGQKIPSPPFATSS